MLLQLDHSSQRGRRATNEDFAGGAIPQGDSLQHKGALVAVADGVGGHARGKEAAEHAVRSLLADYYATPDTWSIEKSLDTIMQAINRWLLSEAHKTGEMAGMATTLTALVLRGRRFHLAHVGDSRAYLLRDGECTQLSEDHTWPHPELSNVLKRAVGLDRHLQVDHLQGDLQAGDRFLLLTDGVWTTLDPGGVMQRISAAGSNAEAVHKLVQDAEALGSPDNCTALLVQVDQLGRDNLRDQLLSAKRLPLPPRLQVGDQLDGLRVLDVIHVSRVTLLYRVERTDGGDPTPLVLKTLRDDASDDEAVSALIYEEWLARRTVGANFPQVRNHPDRRHLYYLMDWYPGETLRSRLDRGHQFTPSEVVALGIRLMKGVAALHRLDITHRDIKPDNLHLASDGVLRILDLGVAASDGSTFREINNPGTPSYMAPELFGDQPANAGSDLYACAVTLYELLTRRYPYGEIEPFQRPKFGAPVPLTRYRPNTPAWLDNLLMRGVSANLAERFETAEEFLLALERGEQRPLTGPRRIPLAARNPGITLKVLLFMSLIGNAVLAWLLSRH